MKITLLQQDITWAHPMANQKAAEMAIMAAERSDVYVLPEMWSTGFATEPDGVAEKDGESLKWMKAMANRMDAAIVGSIATEVEGCFYNRFFFVMPSAEDGSQDNDGRIAVYDKRHLFSYGGEDRTYTTGTERKVVEWRGVRFLLQVCYDLRFPVFARNRYNDGRNLADYDVAIYVASWPTSRRKVWDALLKARAIENQCYVCGVNRVGSDKACDYDGGTVAIDAYGRTVAECPDGMVSAISFDVDIERLKAFRTKFPVLKDGESFTLNMEQEHLKNP